ncbi:MAG: hypothetical protein ACRDHF_15780, partial [Tepidiformaceae bacterium]
PRSTFFRRTSRPAPDRIVGPCIDFDDTPTEGWCYQRVEVEGDTVRLELGIVASDHLFAVILRRNADGSYALVSMVKLTGL